MPRPECKNVTSSQRFDGGFLSSGIVFAGFENLEMMFYIPFFYTKCETSQKKHCYIEISHGAWFNAATQVSVLLVQKSLNARMAPAQHRSPRRCSASEDVSLKCNKVGPLRLKRPPGRQEHLSPTAHSTLRAAANILVKRKLLAYALHTGQSICLDSVLKRQAITAIDHLQRYQLPSTDSIHITTTYFELAWLSLI